MSSRSLPTGTVSPPSREETRRRPATRTDASSPSADELARENERLRRENHHLRERLAAEREERQAIIDRYEGLVEDDGSAAASSASASSPVSPPADSLLARLARFVGLR